MSEFDKIYPALLKAQAKMDSANKDSKNPHFKSTYADFSAVLDACKEILNTEGIFILQPTIIQQLNGADGAIELVDVLKTRLIHAGSGQEVSSECRIICIEKANPQKHGSALTYAKRYNLQSLLVLPSCDDDGQSNFVEKKKPTTVKPTPAKPAPKPAPRPKPNLG